MDIYKTTEEVLKEAQELPELETVIVLATNDDGMFALSGGEATPERVLMMLKLMEHTVMKAVAEGTQPEVSSMDSVDDLLSRLGIMNKSLGDDEEGSNVH